MCQTAHICIILHAISQNVTAGIPLTPHYKKEGDGIFFTGIVNQSLQLGISIMAKLPGNASDHPPPHLNGFKHPC